MRTQKKPTDITTKCVFVCKRKYKFDCLKMSGLEAHNLEAISVGVSF